MSKKTTTQIIMKRDNKYYLLMNIIFTKDNSIYMTFPYNGGRYISKEYIKEYDDSEYSEHTINLEDYKKDNIEPKISFHPKDMIVHINSNISRRLGDDYKLLNIAPFNDALFVYLLQVIFPSDINFYDEVDISNYTDYVIIDYYPNNDYLSLEFIIHTLDCIPTVESLPYSKRRNYRFGYTFDSPYKYTYSIFVSTFEGEGTSNIIATINTKERVCFYTIDKLEQ